mgnify:CR=1 FL=1
MKGLGIGVSTSVGIGADPINGPSFKGILKHFEVNDETHAIVVIGEIGGPLEAEVASYISTNIDKPVVAYVAGLTAPRAARWTMPVRLFLRLGKRVVKG